MLDLSAVATFPSVNETTLSGTPNTLTRVAFPSCIGRKKVSVYPVGHDAYFVTSGSDGAALGAQKTATLPADQWTELPRLKTAICFGSATASTVVKVMLEDRV